MATLNLLEKVHICKLAHFFDVVGFYNLFVVEEHPCGLTRAVLAEGLANEGNVVTTELLAQNVHGRAWLKLTQHGYLCPCGRQLTEVGNLRVDLHCQPAPLEPSEHSRLRIRPRNRLDRPDG